MAYAEVEGENRSSVSSCFGTDGPPENYELHDPVQEKLQEEYRKERDEQLKLVGIKMSMQK